MKNYILLITLLICSQIGFSQVDVNIDKTISLDEEVNENYTPYEYISNGVYKYRVEDRYRDDFKKRIETKFREFEEFIKTNNYTYDVISRETIDHYNSNGYFETFIFRLKDSLGNPLITKKEATKELIELKKLVDLGVLTKEEFDNKAKSLKAIILK
tara:strand:- start:2402 stop:2872 length:471 start_codon:yes stop_codon:yes gene_type:complete